MSRKFNDEQPLFTYYYWILMWGSNLFDGNKGRELAKEDLTDVRLDPLTLGSVRTRELMLYTTRACCPPAFAFVRIVNFFNIWSRKDDESKKKRNRREKIFPWPNRKVKLSPLLHFLKNTPTNCLLRLLWKIRKLCLSKVYLSPFYSKRT